MRLSLGIAALAATFVAASPAFAQAVPITDTVEADARGTVVTPATLTWVSDLDFGTIAPHITNAGTVTVDADSSVRTGTEVALLPGAVTRGEFTGYGAEDQVVGLTLTQPAGGVIISGGNSIPVVLSLDSAGTSRTIGTTGMFTVGVGGVFQIAAQQPNGLYTAEFSLTASYE